MVTIAPAPCRMIRVEVFDDIDKAEELWGIGWAHIIGIACAQSAEFPSYVDVWPVVVGDCPEDGELFVADGKHGCANMRHSAVVPCFWPPEEDKQNAIRIGKELIAKEGQTGGWATIPK